MGLKKQLERIVSFGDGIFETIYAKEGELYAWDAHFQRLEKGAQILKLKLPKPKQMLRAIAEEMKKLATHEAAVKLVIYRDAFNTKGYRYGTEASKSWVYVREFQRQNSQKIDLRVCDHRLSIHPSLSGIKHCNRLDQILAVNETHNQSDGIMLSIENNVIETTSSNLMVLKENEFFTPKLDKCGIEGVMRELYLKALTKMKIKVHEQSFKLGFLRDANAVLIMNSLMGVLPVQSIFQSKTDSSKSNTEIIHRHSTSPEQKKLLLQIQSTVEQMEKETATSYH